MEYYVAMKTNNLQPHASWTKPHRNDSDVEKSTYKPIEHIESSKANKMNLGC